MVLIFLLLIPYKDFFHTSRMMIVGNFLSGLYLAGTLPLVLEVKKKIKFALMILIAGIVIAGLLKFADKSAVKSIVAFRKMGNNLEVAMLDPEDLRTIEFIKKTSNLKILPRLTTPEGIKNVLQQYQKTLEAEFGEIIKKDAGIIQPIRETVQIE